MASPHRAYLGGPSASASRVLGLVRCARGRPRGLAARAAALAALAALACAAAPASASAEVPRSFWGVIPINDLSSSEIDQMGSGNVGTLRMMFLWPAIEPKPDSYDWSC